MRGRVVDHTYEEPGTVSIWRWLGFDRFLPEGKLRPNMTGCPSVRRHYPLLNQSLTHGFSRIGGIVVSHFVAAAY